MRLFVTLSLSALLFATAQQVHAEDVEFLNFRDNMPITVTTNNLTSAQATARGLEIRTNTEGFIVWDKPNFNKPIDVITLRVQSRTNGKGAIMWRPRDEADGLYQVPFDIRGAETAYDIDVILSEHPSWDWKTDVIALRFEPGTDVIIEEMNLRHWSLGDKAIEAWGSFWTFDNFRPYSINFLWGPLIATSDAARAKLYANLPPESPSATRIFYVVLLIAAVAGSATYAFTRDAKLPLGIVAVTFVTLWVIFDIRMGAEIMNYAFDDIRTYVREDGLDKRLRTYSNLFPILDRMTEELKKHERYGIIADLNTVYFGTTRYAAYPSVPVTMDQSQSGVNVWAVFAMPNIQQDEQGRLWIPGDAATYENGRRILTAPGRVTLRIDPGTFIFSADR